MCHIMKCAHAYIIKEVGNKYMGYIFIKSRQATFCDVIHCLLLLRKELEMLLFEYTYKSIPDQRIPDQRITW